jgi:RND family efflux transporter MFP subunit
LQAARETLTESTSDLAAAREERSNAAADADEAQAQVPDAQAQLQAAQADLDYWSAEIDRMRVLLKEGAVSRDEFQREQAQAESAAAKVRQGQAGVAQARARVRGAQSRVRKADAMIQSAVAKTNQSQAQIKGHQARIEQANAEVDAASARVQQAAADIRVAQTEVNAANSRVGQANSELEAHHAHVGQAEAASAAAGQRIAQAQAGAKQARAGLAGAVATQGYTEIRSQIDGIVIQRFISPGVLVSPGQAILRVAQLNPIRLQANVTESDLNRIAVGSPATVYDQEGKHSLAARVTSITPAVDPVSRTGIVEAVVSNAKGWFSPGQYVVMKISIGRSVGGLRIPTRAIQWRTPPSGGVVSTNRVPYVWVATSTAGTVGQFTVEQVDVRVGLSDAHYTEILAGLKERQRVVVTGQQNLRNGDLVSSANAASTTMDDDTGNKSGLESHNMAVSPKVSVAPAAPSAIQSATITVTDQGFEPAHLTLRHGVPARLTFLRKTDATCATEVVIPDYHIKKALPLNQPVVVEITPRKAGSFTFSCGMNMLHGQVVVQ